MILLADREGPDQTVRMRRLIWAFAVRYARRQVFAWRGLILLSQNSIIIILICFIIDIIKLVTMFISHIMGRVMRKSVVEQHKMRRFRSSCACAKYHPGLCFLFTHHIVSSDSISGQLRSGSDCAVAQAGLGLRHYPHIFDTFKHDAVRI